MSLIQKTETLHQLVSFSSKVVCVEKGPNCVGCQGPSHLGLNHPGGKRTIHDSISLLHCVALISLCGQRFEYAYGLGLAMNIAMFSDNFFPELSGISDSIIDLARCLAQMGHRIHLYAPAYSAADFRLSGLDPSEPQLDDNITIHRLCAIHYPTPTNQGRMVVPLFFRMALRPKYKIDIIHTHLFFGVGLEGLAASAFWGVPLIGTNHTPIAEFVRYSPLRNRLPSQLCMRFVSWYYNHCAFVSSPCQHVLDEMKTYGLRRDCKVISNPIDQYTFSPPSSPAEKHAIQADFNLSGFIILYSGRLAAEKHIDVVIRAIKHLEADIPDICLAITGHGKHEGPLRELVRELGLSNRVVFLGTLSVTQLAKLYKAADVFAIASTAETQSLSLMKAMATGVSVVGVNARGLPEYITPDIGFLVPPGHYKALAEKIRFLYHNPALRQEKAQKGLQTVRQWSSECIANKWIEIYRGVTHGAMSTGIGTRSGR